MVPPAVSSLAFLSLNRDTVSVSTENSKAEVVLAVCSIFRPALALRRLHLSFQVLLLLMGYDKARDTPAKAGNGNSGVPPRICTPANPRLDMPLQIRGSGDVAARAPITSGVTSAATANAEAPPAAVIPSAPTFGSVITPINMSVIDQFIPGDVSSVRARDSRGVCSMPLSLSRFRK